MNEGEKIVKLQTQMENIENKVDELKVTAERNNEELKKIMSDFIKKSEENFAGKWVEKVIWSGASIIAGTLIVAILNIILK